MNQLLDRIFFEKLHFRHGERPNPANCWLFFQEATDVQDGADSIDQDLWKAGCALVTGSMAVLCLFTNVGLAFLFGALMSEAQRRKNHIR